MVRKMHVIALIMNTCNVVFLFREKNMPYGGLAEEVCEAFTLNILWCDTCGFSSEALWGESFDTFPDSDMFLSFPRWTMGDGPPLNIDLALWLYSTVNSSIFKFSGFFFFNGSNHSFAALHLKDNGSVWKFEFVHHVLMSHLKVLSIYFALILYIFQHCWRWNICGPRRWSRDTQWLWNRPEWSYCYQG